MEKCALNRVYFSPKICTLSSLPIKATRSEGAVGVVQLILCVPPNSVHIAHFEHYSSFLVHAH